jgi:hypothetical protein
VPLYYPGFMITLKHTTLGRTPLEEGSARRRDFYLTTHNTHKTQTSMPPAGFEPTTPGSKRPQTHALDSAATGIGSKFVIFLIIFMYFVLLSFITDPLLSPAPLSGVTASPIPLTDRPSDKRTICICNMRSVLLKSVPLGLVSTLLTTLSSTVFSKASF